MTIAQKTSALLMGAAFLLAGFMPLTAMAASSKKPTCEVTVTTEAGKTKITDEGEVLVTADEEVELKWTSKNATEATLDGDEIKLKGTEEVEVEKTTTYEFEFENGSKSVTCEVTLSVAEAKITSNLENTSTKPTFSGTADGLKKVTVAVYKEGSSKAVFTKKNLSVKKSGKWSVKVSKPLKEGEYEVRLMNGSTVLDTEDLTVGKDTKKTDKDEDDDKGADDKSDGVLSVSLFPLGLSMPVKAGGSLSAALVEVHNKGTEAVQVTGFGVRQTGTASTATISELSSKDQQGASSVSAKAAWKDNVATASANSSIPPGGKRYFTVKALMGANAVPGTTVVLDIISVKSNAKSTSGSFPIKGTVINVI